MHTDHATKHIKYVQPNHEKFQEYRIKFAPFSLRLKAFAQATSTVSLKLGIVA